MPLITYSLESLRDKHYVWAVLSTLLAAKAYVILGKLEKQNDMLNLAFKISKKLKNTDLCLFINVCLHIVTDELDTKKSNISSEASLRKKSFQSDHSIDTSSDVFVHFMEE